MGQLYCPCRKIGQCHPKVMIYINFVELLSLMFHAKFQNQKVFTIYSHGGHLCHVTWTIYINFLSPFLRMLLDWPTGFRGEEWWTTTDDGAWPSYKLTIGSGELKLITTWHSLTPDQARSWGGLCWHQSFVFEQDILIPVELVSTQEAAAPS